MIEKIFIPVALVITGGLPSTNTENTSDIQEINTISRPELFNSKEGLKPSREEIMELVKDIIEEKLSISKRDIKPKSSFIDDLGADSLDLVELVMTFEKTFCINMQDNDIEKITTVEECVDYIYDNVNNTPVLFYTDYNFTGKNLTLFCDGAYPNIHKINVINSVYITKGFKVTLYSSEDYTGTSVSINAADDDILIENVAKISEDKYIIFNGKIAGKFEVKSFSVDKIK